MDNIEVSYMTLDDLNSISARLSTDFDGFWSYNTIKSEIDKPESIFLVAKCNNEIVGFADIWKAIDIIHLMDIVVAKQYRQKNIASFLLNKIINLCSENNINELTLEVIEKNIPAIKLYKKFNFKVIGNRKNYYGVNNNAIIMTLYIDEFFKEEI